MGKDRGARSGTSSGPGGKARSGQFTGATHLSLRSAKTAGQAGPNRITQAVFSTSTWYVFAGQVKQPRSLLMNGGSLGCRPLVAFVLIGTYLPGYNEVNGSAAISGLKSKAGPALAFPTTVPPVLERTRCPSVGNFVIMPDENDVKRSHSRRVFSPIARQFEEIARL